GARPGGRRTGPAGHAGALPGLVHRGLVHRWLRDHHPIVLFLAPQRGRSRLGRAEGVGRDELDPLVLLVGPLLSLLRPGAGPGRRRPGAGRVGGPLLVGRGLIARTALAADRGPFGQQRPAGAAVSGLVHEERPFRLMVRQRDGAVVPRTEERRRRSASVRFCAFARARALTRRRRFSRRRSAAPRRKERRESAVRSRRCHGRAAVAPLRAAITWSQYSSAAASGRSSGPNTARSARAASVDAPSWGTSAWSCAAISARVISGSGALPMSVRRSRISCQPPSTRAGRVSSARRRRRRTVLAMITAAANRPSSTNGSRPRPRYTTHEAVSSVGSSSSSVSSLIAPGGGLGGSAGEIGRAHV